MSAACACALRPSRRAKAAVSSTRSSGFSMASHVLVRKKQRTERPAANLDAPPVGRV